VSFTLVTHACLGRFGCLYRLSFEVKAPTESWLEDRAQDKLDRQPLEGAIELWPRAERHSSRRITTDTRTPKLLFAQSVGAAPSTSGVTLWNVFSRPGFSNGGVLRTFPGNIGTMTCSV